MLAATAVVGLAVTIYSTGYFSADPSSRFWPLWLFLLASLNALFLSSDIFNLYVALELTGLAAVALTALAGSSDALTAAARYLLVGLLGSLTYLLGVALVYHSFGSVDIATLAERVESTPVFWAAFSLIIAGLALKTALFPSISGCRLHTPVPRRLSARYCPASVVKASFYILLRLWFEIVPADDSDIRQLSRRTRNGRSLLGRTSGLACQAPQATDRVFDNHAGWLFVPRFSVGRRRCMAGSVLPASVARAGEGGYVPGGRQYSVLRRARSHRESRPHRAAPADVTCCICGRRRQHHGLPPSGGFIAKWLMVEASLQSGQWWWAVTLVARGSACRCLRFQSSRLRLYAGRSASHVGIRTGRHGVGCARTGRGRCPAGTDRTLDAGGHGNRRPFPGASAT